MSETTVYEPKPEYVVQVGEALTPASVISWEPESYHFTIKDATESADYLALSSPYVRVIRREVS